MSSASLSNLRAAYFARSVLRLAVPSRVLRARLEPTLARLGDDDLRHVLPRVAYYNRAASPFELPPDADRWRWSAFKKQRNYCFDLLEHLRWFDMDLRLAYRFGDDTDVPATPTIVKARPVGGDNHNSVLLKLNKARHFRVVRDRRPFASKRDQVVWRGNGYQPHRKQMLAACFDDPSCDVGCTDDREAIRQWRKPFLSIDQQLESKFVLSIEGNDVATNLKWILASNSVCLMRRPRFETWFQEGALVPDRHYVLLEDDHSDLPEKVRFYAARPDLCQGLLRNAQAHAAQFRDERRERAIALLVLLKYFVDSGQVASDLLERVRQRGGGSTTDARA